MPASARLLAVRTVLPAATAACAQGDAPCKQAAGDKPHAAATPVAATLFLAGAADASWPASSDFEDTPSSIDGSSSPCFSGELSQLPRSSSNEAAAGSSVVDAGPGTPAEVAAATAEASAAEASAAQPTPAASAPTAAAALPPPGAKAGYSASAYWDDRYAQDRRGRHFDWFLSYSALRPLLQHAMTMPAAPVLHVGCGNSDLSIGIGEDGTPVSAVVGVGAILQLQAALSPSPALWPPHIAPQTPLVSLCRLHIQTPPGPTLTPHHTHTHPRWSTRTSAPS